jgi:hypothetical protein
MPIPKPFKRMRKKLLTKNACSKSAEKWEFLILLLAFRYTVFEITGSLPIMHYLKSISKKLRIKCYGH